MISDLLNLPHLEPMSIYHLCYYLSGVFSYILADDIINYFELS